MTHGPAGWPQQVPPPEHPGWETSAVRWLLDLCPPEYRAYGVLTRHPIVLARFAHGHVKACLQAARTGFAGARADLSDVLTPEQVEEVLAAYEREGRRLVSAEVGVGLVREALAGRRFPARL
jgi:hypothetical protein